MSNPVKYGEFKCKLIDIIITANGMIYTRCAAPDHTEAKPSVLTHVVRLAQPDSKESAKTSERIGMDELRSAFPKELGTLTNHGVLVHLLTNTSKFHGRDVTIAVEPQLKDGKQVIGKNNQPLYNIRLRSAMRDMDANSADALAKRLLGADKPISLIETAKKEFAQKAS